MAPGDLCPARADRQGAGPPPQRRPQVVSNWETGRTAVPDEMAHHLSRTLELPVLAVRRGLRMWVPDEPGQVQSVEELIEQDPLLATRDKDDLLSYLRI